METFRSQNDERPCQTVTGLPWKTLTSLPKVPPLLGGVAEHEGQHCPKLCRDTDVKHERDFWHQSDAWSCDHILQRTPRLFGELPKESSNTQFPPSSVRLQFPCLLPTPPSDLLLCGIPACMAQTKALNRDPLRSECVDRRASTRQTAPCACASTPTAETLAFV